MKKLIVLIFMISGFSGCAQVNFKNVIKDVNTATGKGLSNEDIIKGLKEALSIGSKNAAGSASKENGYYLNNLVKIPFPQEEIEMKNTLVNMGMKNQVEEFEKQMNRAAEDAAKKAAPIFMDAITHMTITDGLTILNGKDDEATQYLKRTTTSQLTNQFTPVIAASLQKVEITKYWNPLMTTYNKVPFVTKVNPNLESYVTQKAIEGLFKLVAIEETKIRKDPSARVTDILKKVFAK